MVVSLLTTLGFLSSPENVGGGGMATLAAMDKQELSNDYQGTYLVTTATGSRYMIDLTARTMRRQMAATAPRLDYLPAGF